MGKAGSWKLRDMLTNAGEIDKMAARIYLDLMRSVGLKVLKNKRSEYVLIVNHIETNREDW